MSNENQNQITFNHLKDYLERIGFNRSTAIESSLAFRHDDSGVIVSLSIPEDGVSIRPADLLSILVRLESNAIESEEGIWKLRQGQIPTAAK